jgi:hypothetical protein
MVQLRTKPQTFEGICEITQKTMVLLGIQKEWEMRKSINYKREYCGIVYEIKLYKMEIMVEEGVKKS